VPDYREVRDGQEIGIDEEAGVREVCFTRVPKGPFLDETETESPLAWGREDDRTESLGFRTLRKTVGSRGFPTR
jgi:hypothetical protein